MNELRIIIVEDSENDAELLLSRLREADYLPSGPRVETEADFLEALRTVPDIIFSDYSMPHFSGMRALEIAKSVAPDIPFILVSGTVGEEIAVQSMLLGATDYLLKDSTLRLASAVKRALDEKRLRYEQAKALESLRHSEERFREVVENIREVFWVSNDEKTKIHYISPGYERTWGLPCDTIYESPLSWLDLVHPDDRDRIRERAQTKQVLGQYDEVYRIIKPDGSLRWIHDRAFPITDADGKVRRIVGIAEDISEQKKLENQLRQAQKMEAIGQLAGGVAHDFNNILQAMMMQIDLALHRVAQDGTRQLLLGLQQSAERASHLTRQLLAFGRKNEMQVRKIDLNESIKNVMQMLERVVGEQIEIVKQLHEKPLVVVADTGMIDQILMNLVVNARDAMPEGGRLEISTGTELHTETPIAVSPEIAPGWYARISVTDTGSGILPDHMPRLFEPFFTTKGVGHGTGLGLPVIFGIVQQHSGGIRVESTPGNGARFDVLLPLAQPTAENAPIVQKVNALPGNGTVLIVEDETEVRRLSQMLLERSGYRVFTAGNGAEALDIFKRESERIDVLFTDLVMPGGLNGRQLAEVIQQESPRIKVILATGYNPETAGQDVPLKSGQVLLRKPFKSNELLEALRNATKI
ncbi:response regulator [Turneriella parva]|uniref:histidine kinase n=1 Tax=Turneriella parva (strain ATCC BAA-1111 / DSM 21527 / NCTC 11395 / H) TaxID=869212 RepID=I4B3D7_TURPD|nr:response regulator [Turneriella parva]AFM11794.1 PAS/PAC sensor hybrid histidine kinase [Turneriella parva DSM 21527]